MARVVRTPQAELDLLEAWVYIGEDSVRAADRWLASIAGKCRALARSPLAGRIREDLAPGLRSLPVGSYVIFYRPRRDGIEIIRVLHGARDVGAIFPSASPET